MQPYQQDVTSWRGDYYAAAFRVRSRVWNPMLNNGTGGWEPGPYKDLTGWTGDYQLRDDPDTTTAAATGVVEILDQVTYLGGVRYHLPGTAVVDLAGPYFYDVQLTDPDGNPRTFVAGTHTFDKDVTRVP